MTSLAALHIKERGQHTPPPVTEVPEPALAKCRISLPEAIERKAPPPTLAPPASFVAIRKSVQAMLKRMGEVGSDDLAVPYGYAVTDTRWAQQYLCGVDTGWGIPTRLVIQAVALESRMTVDLLLGDIRAKSIARPRQLAMWILTKHVGLSHIAAVRALGKTDHSTSIHATKVIEREMKTDADLLDLWRRVQKRLGVMA